MESAHKYASERWDKVSPIVTAPDGKQTFYITDPENNWFQAVQDDYLLLDEGKEFGGMLGCMIGVTDMGKTIGSQRERLRRCIIVSLRTS